MVLKNLVFESGSICYCDGNQNEYVADFVPLEKRCYPYRDATAILDDWFRARSDDQALRDELTISGLSSALKAEKRAELAQKLTASADVRIETELKIGRVAPLSRRAGVGRDRDESTNERYTRM